MADFKQAYQITMGHEGTYANDPDDSGGETWKGVARKRHPGWGGWVTIDAAKKQPGFPDSLKGNPQLELHVRAFYKENFWNRLSLDAIQDQRIANELFDTGVNCGTGVAALFLQRALNVTNRAGKDYPNLVLDGSIGPKTVAVLNTHRRPADVLKTLNILQGAKYIEICENKESQEKWFSGWLTRVELN